MQRKLRNMGSIRRVVVTGLGLVTPLGIGAPHNWLQITAGKVATSSLTDPRYAQMPCRIAASIPKGKGEGQLDLSSYFSASDLRTMTPAIAYALIAAQEAVEDARWTPSDNIEQECTGVAVGMGMVDLDDVTATGQALHEKYSKIAFGVAATIIVLANAAALPAASPDAEAEAEPFMGMGMGMGMMGMGGMYSMLYPLLLSSMYGYGMYGMGGLGMMGMYGMGGLGFGLLW